MGTFYLDSASFNNLSATSQTLTSASIDNLSATTISVTTLNAISSSILYFTSSQLNVSNNLITVNTSTPLLRFGGLAVFDSGSTGKTGSLLWDSTNDVWIYSNPSGATYDGAMILAGPRNSTGLGNEVGINSGYAAIGNGSHHMTSSAIYNSGSLIRLENTTHVTGSLNVSSNTSVATNLSVGTTLTTSPLTVISSASPLMTIQSTTANSYSNIRFSGSGRSWTAGVGNASETNFSVANEFFIYDDTLGAMRMTIDTNGNVGIGTTSPVTKLHVIGNSVISGSLTVGSSSLGSTENTLVVGPAPAGGIGEGGQILLQAPNSGGYTSASMIDNYQNFTRLLRGNNTTSDAIVAQWNMHTKQMQIPQYNSATAFTGSIIGSLGIDSGGNILTSATSLDMQVAALQAMGSSFKGYNIGCPIITNAINGQGLTSGTTVFTAMYIHTNTTLTGVKFLQQTQGNYTANNYNGVGLYSTSGGTLTLVVSSSNDGNIWKAASNTLSSKSFGSTYNATPGIYYIGALYSNSAQVTAPAIGFAGSAAAGTATWSSLDFTNGNKMNGSSGSAGTALSPTVTATGISNIQYRFAFYLY